MSHFEQKRNIDLTAKDSIGWTPFRNEPLILMLWMDSMNSKKQLKNGPDGH